MIEFSQLKGLIAPGAGSRTPRPNIACEFTPTHIAAARSGPTHAIDTTAVRTLAAGALAPNLIGPNIVDRKAVAGTLRDAVSAFGKSARDVILVVPDACCRIALLDFDEAPAKRADADAVIRFRLKKSLPFDVDRARISWQLQPVRGKINVVVAVMLTSVLEEYEAVAREAGLNPGAVMPSMLATLGEVDAAKPTVVMRVDPVTTSIVIVSENALLLSRALDHTPGEQPGGAQLAEDIFPSVVFFEDTYGTKVERILVSGLPELEDLNAALVETTGLVAEDLVSATRIDAPPALRAALGSVAGALA